MSAISGYIERGMSEEGAHALLEVEREHFGIDDFLRPDSINYIGMGWDAKYKSLLISILKDKNDPRSTLAVDILDRRGWADASNGGSHGAFMWFRYQRSVPESAVRQEAERKQRVREFGAALEEWGYVNPGTGRFYNHTTLDRDRFRVIDYTHNVIDQETI